ncbi:MAG: hypothetical protein ACKO2K_16615, partial [Alphaproteobacteria bacterium]
MLAAPGHELAPEQLDAFLAVVDWSTRLREVPVGELDGWLAAGAAERAAIEDRLRATLAALRGGPTPPARAPGEAPSPPGEAVAPATAAGAAMQAGDAATGPRADAGAHGSPPTPAPTSTAADAPGEARGDAPAAYPTSGGRATEASDRSVKVSADTLGRLAGLAAEALVEARSIGPAADAVREVQRRQADVAARLGRLRDAIASQRPRAEVDAQVESLAREIDLGREALADRTEALDALARRAAPLAERLYGEALATRMRPFADVLAGLPRQVRDLARSLGRQVRLEVAGRDVPVDRDVLAGLEAPLGHLVRNAIDHGLEPPADRE